MVRARDAEEAPGARGSASGSASPPEDFQGSFGSPSYPLPGVQASGAIVVSSLSVLLGLGAVGLMGLHAYVHRYDSV